MKRWKSILSAALAGVMILSTAASVAVGAANVTFTDTGSHWAKTQINYLVSKDVLNGYKQDNGTYQFKPDGTVTRAEFIKMLDETFGLTATKAISYSDVKTTDWFYPYFAKAAAQGYLLNYGNSVAPNSALTREEATTLLVRYLGLLNSEKAPASTFSDYSQISDHYKDAVLIAVKSGLINGYNENGVTMFKPKNTLTRAEALTILYRAAGAIYNASAYAKDSSAPTENAVITKGGVTLSGMTLSGRVIVTEGATSDSITLTGSTVSGTLYVRGTSAINVHKSTVQAMQLDSTVMVALGENAKITSLTLQNAASLYIPSGCHVENLVVNSGAKNVRITGSGTIGKITVYASGLESTIMPTEFYIAAGLTANFASSPYTGSSDDQAAFSIMPYLTNEDEQYYLNVIPDMTGRVYYYYTNMSSVPSAADFDGAYSAATYKDSFYVQAGKTYSQKTIDAAQGKKYDYVMIQMVTDTRSYAPVIIESTATSGTGFAVDPYYDGEDIVYSADISGTVYYYYSAYGESLTASDFQAGYKNADSAMRGTENARSGKTDTIELTSRYLDNYPFVIVALQNMNGQYFKPIVIAAGDNGFTDEPTITTLGTIEFRTNTSGTMYYYYAKEDKLPTPSDFADQWPREYGNSSVTVTRNRTDTISYEKEYAERYPYMVFCIRDNDKNYLTPYVLKIEHDTGFTVDPYVSGNEEISYRAAHGGTVYWYFTKYNTLPTSDDFMKEYNYSANARCGYDIVTSTSMYDSFSFDSSYVYQYPYIAVMLVGSDKTEYQPVLVDIMNTTATGFDQEPYCDLTEEAVYFKAAQSGTIYYYFSRTSKSYNETVEDFWDSYNTARYYGSYDVTTNYDYIPFSTIDTNNYPGIMLMLTDDKRNEFYPVYVSLQRDGSSGTSNTTGVTVLSVDSESIEISVDASGSLTYYFMGYGTNTYSKYESNSKLVNKNGVVTITNPGRYSYLVVKLEGYDPYTIDLTNDYDRNEERNDGSNKSGYGFSSQDVKYENGKLVFTAVANVDGTVTGGISTLIGSSDTATVKKGEVFTMTFDYDLDTFMNTTVGQLIGAGSLQIQLTSGSSVYERLDIKIG